MTKNKITPALWFHTKSGSMQEVIGYYSKIFEDDFKIVSTHALGQTPSGNAEMCNILLFDNTYMMMATEKEHHMFNDTFAIMIHCDDQDEIDKFWKYFTQQGQESMCGWCIDKFGLRWQIIPKNLNELMSKPNAWEVMSRQTKIIINEY